MRVYADLHVHTTASDGTLALADLPDAAAAAGVGAVAVTDHDRIHQNLDEPVLALDDLLVVRGVELRVAAPAERVDLLGYAVERTPALTDELDRVQRGRVERGRAIIDAVEDSLGVDLALDAHDGIGRPHIARAVASHPDLEYTVDEAFADLIGNGRPCYVARPVPDFETGADLLSDACSLVALAHPFRYDDPGAALDLLAHDALDAVERYYPYGDDPDPAPVDRAIDRHGLLPVGGSDAHDATLGVAGLDRAGFRAVRERLPAPAPWAGPDGESDSPEP